LDITPFTIILFRGSSVGWQNGRILGALEVNALLAKALQLEKYSAKGSAIWQNGRILFERRAKPRQIIKYFCDFAPEMEFLGLGSQTEFGNQGKRTSGEWRVGFRPAHRRYTTIYYRIAATRQIIGVS
jgi:hypothetical protein